MGTHGISSDNLKSALTHLSEHGYAVIEDVLSEGEVQHYRGLRRNFLNERGSTPLSQRMDPHCRRMLKWKRI